MNRALTNAPDAASGVRRCRRLQLVTLAALALQLLATALTPLTWGGWMLLLLLVLKWRESGRARDLRHGALAQMVLVGVLAVLEPGLATSLLQGATALLILLGLLALESGSALRWRRLLALALRLLAGTLPLMLLLFLFLPRMGPLWSVPFGGMGSTGLSAQLDPGSITNLVQDPSPALRIELLHGSVPPPNQRYWRVMALDGFNGRRWSQRRPLTSSQLMQIPTTNRAGVVDQLWTVEPSPVRELPWGGVGRPLTPGVAVNGNGELISLRPGRERRRYGLSGTFDPDERPAGSWWRGVRPSVADLAVPPGSNPRLEALGKEWGRTLPPTERVEAAARLFRSEPFRYTLKPPPLPGQAPLDAFLFRTRAGFCEHYASAFTVLMRTAGLPARVVVGYLGGEWIPVAGGTTGVMDVRQRDAHAWSEVWIPRQGWTRIDPTGFVAPERVEQGLQGALAGSNDLSLLRFTPGWLLGVERGWWRLDGLWSRWVVQFDGQSQDGLLNRLLGGFRSWQGVILVAGLALSATLAVAWIRGLDPSGGSDGPRRDLEGLLARLQPIGLQPEPGEGLEHFCRRSAKERPDLAQPLMLLSRDYMRLRCAPGGVNPASRKRWRRSCRQIAAAMDHALAKRGHSSPTD
ncbi:DUF3488 domain-containing protein [Synechococcus sp. RSCCF101]|uniref:transglutaminase family protein n=1 Tax=Synechococcus sp. RSCCF101 TaxID=2511069 RepID=UPI0012452CFE|nr:transglutaminaseTgpA domain-containing protein [Synechococcus sp. RSCCF101]QEY32811.1 DUF3488 domain-containing protein [Synechococcus sp. RSCCF101]